MHANISQKQSYSEADVQTAISDIEKGNFTSIRKAARAYDIPYATLRHCMAGRNSRATAHQVEQILSNAEEKTLSQWITRLTRTGFPASPALVVQMAEEV